MTRLCLRLWETGDLGSGVCGGEVRSNPQDVGGSDVTCVPARRRRVFFRAAEVVEITDTVGEAGKTQRTSAGARPVTKNDADRRAS